MTNREETSDGTQGRISENIGALVEKVLSFRYLRGLSDDKREDLRADLEFIRTILIDQRPPRLAIVGSPRVELEQILRAVVGESLPADLDVKSYLGQGRWYDYEVRNAAIELLDLRSGDGEEVSFQALERQAPDLVLFAWQFRPLDEEDDDEDPTISTLARAVEAGRSGNGPRPPIVGLFDASALPEDVTANRAERILRTRIRKSDASGARTRVTPLQDVRQLDAELMELAPEEARLQLAQAMQTAESKERLARHIIRASAGVAATFATIPLPFADILPITSVQILMISAIAHLSGRRFSLRTTGEFAAAVGLNVGAGYAVREVARAIVQFIPFGGSVISSGIAAGATYALGNAAARYFIDEDLEDFDAAPERVQEPAWQRSTQ